MQNGEYDRTSGLDIPKRLDQVQAAPGEQNSSTKPQSWENERLAWPIDDFCRAIGLGRTKVYAMIGDGTLRTVMIGGRRLVPRDAAEALLKQAAA
jgi:excisionase family DNA binding protein